jgi:hypothetical protein
MESSITLKLTINGASYELTTEEAKVLYAQLKALVGEQYPAYIYPFYPTIQPFYYGDPPYAINCGGRSYV